MATQTTLPTELIVVDNASTDETAHIVAQFAKNVNFPVRRVVEKTLGYPVVYNHGLIAAKTDWVIFIDDDCVAEPQWLAAFVAAIKKLTPVQTKNLAAFVGASETQQPASVWALTVLAADQFWKRSVVTAENEVWDLETLDNKNIAYYKPFLTKHQVQFNEAALLEPGAGAAEDADLGMQLQAAGGRAFFVAEARILHQDPNQLVWYYRRLLSGARANFYYQKRWQKFRHKKGLVTRRAQLHFKDFWSIFCQQQKLHGLRQWLVLLIVLVSFKLVQLWHWWWQITAKL